MESNRLFVDMDGTLAKFRQVAALEELYEPGYFAELPPQQNVVDAVRLLICTVPTIEVFILSSVLFDSRFAMEEKNAWLDQYLPELDEGHRIFLPCGESKSSYLPGKMRESDCLLDDYTKNLEDWSHAGGTGIKLLNGINHTRGSWKDRQLRFDKDPVQLVQDLIEIVEHSSQLRDEKPMPNLEKYCAAMERAGYVPMDADRTDNNLILWRNRQSGKMIGLDGIDGVKDFLAKAGRHVNAGYEIIQAIEVANDTYVLGQGIKDPSQFVTWRKISQPIPCYEWGHYFFDKLAAQKDLLKRSLESCENEAPALQTAALLITDHSEHIHVDGHEGTWYTIGCETIHGVEYFLLEHEKYGDETAGVIVNSSGKVVCEDIWNGFDDLAEFLPNSMSIAEQESFIRDMNLCKSMSEHEEEIYSTLINLQAGRAIDAHEVEYGADGCRVFPGSLDFEPEI